MRQLRDWLRGVKAVLFDLDGVLLDSRGLHDAALRDAYAVVQPLLPPLSENVAWGEEAERSVTKLARVGVTDPVLVEKIRAEKLDCYLRRLLSDDSPARWHDVGRLSAALGGRPWELVTSFSWERGALPEVLHAMALERVFDQIFAPHDSSTTKVELYSAARSWLEHCRSLGVEEALVLEDSDVGIAAAKAAGFENTRKTTFDQLGAML